MSPAQPRRTRTRSTAERVREAAAHPRHPALSPGRSEDSIGERDLGIWRTPVGRWLARVAASIGARVGLGPAVVLVLALGTVVTGAFSMVAEEVYDAVAEKDGIALLDQPALDAAVSVRSPGLDHAATVFTDIGGPTWMPVVSAVLAIGLALLWRTWLPILLTLVATAGSLAMTVAGKNLVGRVRPPLSEAVPPFEHSPSFPSGHTLNTTVVLGVLAYVALTRLSGSTGRAWVVGAALAWTFAMGLSRVYLGHHWLSDVAMGWMLGLAWVGALVTTHRAWITARRHRDADGPAEQGKSGAER